MACVPGPPLYLVSTLNSLTLDFPLCEGSNEEIILPAISVAVALTAVAQSQSQIRTQNSGILLENLTWLEAEKILKAQTVVVIPIGAAAKEHGPHLKLKNDWVLAEYLKKRVLASSKVVIAPTVPYHFYLGGILLWLHCEGKSGD